MKKLLLTLTSTLLLFATTVFFGCTGTTGTNNSGTENTSSSTEDDEEEDTSGSKTSDPDVQDYITTTEVTTITIDGSKLTGGTWAFATISLADFAGKTVTVDLSAKMKVVNSGSEAATLMWQVTAAESSYPISSYPIVCSNEWAAGTSDYTSISGTKSEITLGDSSALYISANELTVSEFIIYLQKFSVTVTDESDSTNTKTYTAFDTSDAVSSKTEEVSINLNWRSDDVPSLYEAYEDYFDYVGFAVEYGNFGTNWGTPCELYYDEVQAGLKKHANTISLGNEFKPQFIFSWWGNGPSATTSFTGSNGVTTTVPTTASLSGLNRVDDILTICKNNGLKMRGHVLLWHSQTDDAFFTEDYTSGGDLVSADQMDARLEWYIKTVLNHVADWEKNNNNGEHIIWAWDVINEVTSDGSTSTAATSSTDSDWLRTSGSKWYTIYNNSSSVTNYYTGSTYKSYDFIINAFRFANKYAPSDVKLCYNDYGGLSGTSTSNKHQSQLRVAQLILDHESDSSWPTRFDAMGLQSHYSVKNSAAAYQTEIQDFIAKGLDVQITELDIATCDKYDATTDTVGTSGAYYSSLAAAYSAFFKMFLDNRKIGSANGVDSVTIWGLYDEATWLNTAGQNYWLGSCLQYPLLFTLDNQVSSATNTYNYYTDYSSGTTAKLATLDAFDDGDTFYAKNAYFNVINVAESYSD